MVGNAGGWPYWAGRDDWIEAAPLAPYPRSELDEMVVLYAWPEMGGVIKPHPKDGRTWAAGTL